ncbi:MAG: DUF2470 domain-containing protein [Pseudomonadota bacterium]
MMPKKPNPIKDTTPEAVRHAKTLIRTARFGALAVVDTQSGAPAVSRVTVATDPVGSPVILISQLSPHFAALEANAEAAILLGEPGKGDPLAHPRISVTVQAQKLTGQAHDAQRWRFLQRHPKAALYADFSDFAFWRLSPKSASLNAGFGKAFELTSSELLTTAIPELDAMASSAIEHMNADHLDAIAHYAKAFARAPEAEWRLATLDAEGLDLICSDAVVRVWFDPPLANAGELRPRLVEMARSARS